MPNDNRDGLGPIYDRIRQVEQSVGHINVELAKHVSECGQLREMQRRALDGIDGKVGSVASKVDALVGKVSLIETSIATIAARDAGASEEREWQHKTVGVWIGIAGVLVSVAAIAVSVVIVVVF